MVLSKTSRLARFCYYRRRMPERTTLCAFFWQCFVIVPAVWIALTLLSLFLLWKAWFVLIPSLIFMTLLVKFGERVDKKLRKWKEKAYQHYLKNKELRKKPLLQRVHESFFIQGLIALKKKFCPIIEIS